MFTLQEISRKENNLIQEALKTHTDYFRVSCDYLSLLNSVKSVDKNYLLFLDFHLNVVNDFALAILSIVRRHFLQSQFNYRHALESAVIACYTFEDNNINNYLEMQNDITVEPKDIRNKSYKWLEKNYPEYSKKIKYNKDLVNKFHAHSNNIMAEANRFFQQDNNKFNLLVFDGYPDNYIDAVLVTFINSISDVLGLYREVNNNYNKISFEIDLEKLNKAKESKEILKKNIIGTLNGMLLDSFNENQKK